MADHQQKAKETCVQIALVQGVEELGMRMMKNAMKDAQDDETEEGMDMMEVVGGGQMATSRRDASLPTTQTRPSRCTCSRQTKRQSLDHHAKRRVPLPSSAGCD